jgi:hypothetical protein
VNGSLQYGIKFLQKCGEGIKVTGISNEADATEDFMINDINNESESSDNDDNSSYR